MEEVADFKKSTGPLEVSTSAAAALPTMASAADWRSLSGTQTSGKTYPGGFHEGLAREGYLFFFLERGEKARKKEVEKKK